MTAAGSFALGVAAAKLLRQRSMHGSAAGAPFNPQVSGASRFSVAAGRMPAAAAAAAGPADTVVVVEGGAPALPSPDLISALAAIEAATAQADSMQSNDATEAAGLPAAASPSVEAAAAGPPARQPRRTTFSAREYMQAAGLASLTAAAGTQQQQQQQLVVAPMELPDLAMPSKARRASSNLGSPASMTGGQFGSLSSMETGESAATWSVDSQGTETEAGAEAGHITPEAGQTAVARAPQGALAPPPIPLLGSADDAEPASPSRDLARRAPALLAQVKQLLVLPTQALPAVLARAVGGGTAPAEDSAPGQRRRASWRGFEQACPEELAATRQQAQQLAAALPPPAFGK